MIREWLLRVGKQVFLFYCGYGFYEPEQFNKPSAPPNQPESPYTGHPHRRKAG